MKKLPGSVALLCGIVLLSACSKTEPPKEEAEALVEAPKTDAEAQVAAETMLTSLKASAAEGLNVPVTIQLNSNGKPAFLGSNGAGIICKNPMCQPPSLKDRSYGFDSSGNLTLNNWDGAVQFIITVAAPGFSFPTDPSQAVAIVAGTSAPGKGQWNSQFTNPIGTPDLKTISFSDKNSQNGVWEYSVTIQNNATKELVTLDPTVKNGGVGNMEPEAAPKP
jgi:hypothetical protein